MKHILIMNLFPLIDPLLHKIPHKTAIQEKPRLQGSHFKDCQYYRPNVDRTKAN